MFPELEPLWVGQLATAVLLFGSSAAALLFGLTPQPRPVPVRRQGVRR
jgi:hypothetical protein